MFGPEFVEALERSLSSQLPLGMWPKKHGSSGAPHEKFFSIDLLQDSEPVILARLDQQSPDQGGDAFFEAIARLLASTIAVEPSEEGETVVIPLGDLNPDRARLEKAFDLANSELRDVDKAITIRVAAKECM